MFGLAAAIIVVTSTGTSGHRRDEYLQAARVGLEPRRALIELDLTAGTAVADNVLAEIDRDRTGTISAAEAAAYVAVVRRAITLEVDGTAVPVELVASSFPAIEAVRRGEGAIRLRLAGVLPALAAGPHQLLYRNGHRADIGVYLANVLVPLSDRVAISTQRRDVDQRELIVDYVLSADAMTAVRGWFLPSLFGILALAALGWLRQRTAAVQFNSTTTGRVKVLNSR